VFDDLDATLRALLDADDAPAEVHAADVSFDTPGRDFAPPRATVNLFLHDVQENRVLRDTAPRREPVNGGFVERRPPLRVDCTYLATAWSQKSGDQKAAEEHRLLGLTLLWMSRFPVIEDRFLRGGLLNPPPLYRLPAVVAQTPDGQNLGQFWSALGIPPRPAFSVTVTLALAPFDQEDQYPAVAAVQVEGTLLTGPVLAGRVLDAAALTAVPAARVTVVENGRQTTSGSTGRFAFADLEFGDYTLLVQAADRPDVRAPVKYKVDSQVHNVIVPGP
jgi:hypothetical protein